MADNDEKGDTDRLLAYCKTVLEENEALKAILKGAVVTIDVGDMEKKELLLGNLLAKRDLPAIPSDIPAGIGNVPVKDKQDQAKSHREKDESSSLCDDYVQGTVAGEEMVREDDEKPRFYKKDLLRILEDKNQCKEQADLLREELEEWKRAALEAQEKVESLESEIEEVHKRVGGFYYPNEIQANALGMLPRGPNFRPQPVAEATELFIADVEVAGCAKLESKFVFAIHLTWSDKKRFEVYRRYGEFFTLQNTLLLLFPEEAGKHKSSERIIPSLPTADNILAIIGATNSKSAVESRLQLIDNYCNTLLLQLPKRISRSPLIFDFFKARPSDKQLESLKRPISHSLELSVYPLMPQGKSQGFHIAIADYEVPPNEKKKSSNKISLKKREVVRVVKEDESGWTFVQKTESGECGYVPASFIKKAGDPTIPDASIDVGSVLGFLTSVGVNGALENGTAQASNPESFDHSSLQYVAICEYETADERQLSFPEGAVILVIDKSEDGWWFGNFEGRDGWVPSTYLEPCSEQKEDIAQEIEGQDYQTTQTYTAKDEDEISLPSGVTVKVLEKSLTGWWKVSYRRRTGYAPSTMLKPGSLPATPGEEPESPTHGLLHSLSGMKRPPPRRKHVTKKKRAKTFMAPIEEQEDVGVVLTATTVCEEGLQVRRASILDILRRGTGEYKKKTKQQEGQLEPENLKRLNTDGKISSSRPKSSIDPERRNNLLANISLKIENKN